MDGHVTSWGDAGYGLDGFENEKRRYCTLYGLVESEVETGSGIMHPSSGCAGRCLDASSTRERPPSGSCQHRPLKDAIGVSSDDASTSKPAIEVKSRDGQDVVLVASSEQVWTSIDSPPSCIRASLSLQSSSHSSCLAQLSYVRLDTRQDAASTHHGSRC